MNSANYLRETIDLTKSIETRFMELATRLYKIREEKLYLGTYDSFFEFLEVANINPGQASKLMSIHRVFIEEGKQTQETLAKIGYSNLYEAIPLVETQGMEVVMAKVETLTRSEIKDEVRDFKHGEHIHQAKDNRRFAVCSCGKFIELYEHN
jgi:hypothetical protein